MSHTRPLKLYLVGSTYFSHLALGTAHCVGVVGATLGAGISGNQGYMGLLIDLLEEAQVVTSTGDVVTASRRENPDLFWALRCAGANFGIVTSATYTVPKTPNNGNVTNASYLYQGSKAREVYEYLATLDDDMSAFLALNIVALVDPNSGQVCSRRTNCRFAFDVNTGVGSSHRERQFCWTS